MSPSELAGALERLIGSRPLERWESGALQLPPLRLPPVLSEGLGAPLNQPSAMGVSAHSLRPYELGDDLRHLDLKRYLKSQALYVKRFDEERSGALAIILDASASMGAFHAVWRAALSALYLTTEAALRGGSVIYWLIERDRALTALKPLRGVHDAAAQASALEQLSPSGERAAGELLKRALRGLPVGCSCLYLTDLLGSDVALSDRADENQTLARARFPTPHKSRWSACLRLESPALWRPQGLVRDPELGGRFESPRTQAERARYNERLGRHYQAWTLLLKEAQRLPVYPLRLADSA